MVACIFLCHASDDKAHVREVYHRLWAITSGAKMETLVPVRGAQSGDRGERNG